MQQEIIGRKQELAVLEKAWQSTEAELVAVFGRRRVGKTFLVRGAYAHRMCSEMTGIPNGNSSPC